MANRETLIGHFDTGDRPTQNNFHDFINSTINNTEGKSQHISDIFCLASGSSDNFHQVVPPFVPNLQEYIKVFNLTPHIGLQSSGSTWVDPNETDTDKLWTIRSNGNFENYTDQDFPYGGFKLTSYNAATQDDALLFNNIKTSPKSFKIQNGNPFWLKTRIKIPDYANTTFFFGLTNSPISNLIEDNQLTDLIGIQKPGSGTNIEAVFRNHSVLGSNSILDCKAKFELDSTVDANNVILDLGIIYNGGTDFFFYTHKSTTASDTHSPMLLDKKVTMNSVETEDDLGTSRADSFMKPILHLKQVNASTPCNIIFEYIHAAILTKTSS